MRAAILCRGYGSVWEVEGGIISPGDASLDAGLCGDEATLLHELAPDAWLGVGADRVRQFRKMQKTIPNKIDLVILDDGFQHWKIKKDIELVAVTSARRDDTIFRDWAGALKSADLVVWTKGDEQPASFGKPLVKVRFRLEPQASGKSDLYLVTGIGDDQSAKNAITAAGYRVRRHLSFPDHARYDGKMAREILASARGEGCQLAMTGKDWVKWRGLGVTRSEVLVFEPEIVFEEGREHWDRILWG
jgi:tetraacyldisaccharide 4'-kinase